MSLFDYLLYRTMLYIEAVESIRMTMKEAYETLGLKPGASADEVKKAYRAKIIACHPDLNPGVDVHEQAVRINIAKDIIDGRRHPDPEFDFGAWYSQQQRQPPRPPPPPPRPVNFVHVSFDDARRAANIPPNVEWIFVTGEYTSQKRDMPPSQKRYGSSEKVSGWVMYGTTSTYHVFLGIEHKVRVINDSRGEAERHDVWSFEYHTYPIKVPLSDIVPKAINASLGGINFHKRVVFDGTIRSMKGKWLDADMDWAVGRVSKLSDLLVQLGKPPTPAPTADPRGGKHVIELLVQVSDTASYDHHPSAPLPDSPLYGRFYRVVLIVNGREYPLAASDINLLTRVRISGKDPITLLFGSDTDPKLLHFVNGRKNLTATKVGKPLLLWMSAGLKQLSQEVRDVLVAASAKMRR